MIGLLFPASVDNTFRGNRFAIWLFVPLVALQTVVGFNSIFFAHAVATGADAIPLDTFAPAAAQTVLALFATLGLAHLVRSLLCWIVLFHYRALVPLMFAMLLLEQLSTKVLRVYYPIPRLGPMPGSIVIYALLGLTIAGLALSLWPTRDLPTPAASTR